MKSLNILELHRTINEKKTLKNEVFERVLSKCHRRIELNAENQKLKCFFEVPEFVVGYPLYDIKTCIEFTLNSLNKNGFLVKYFFPKILYISWDLDEISNKPPDPIPVINKNNYLTMNKAPIKIVNAPQKTYKPLLSSSIQKNNGKLSLNII